MRLSEHEVESLNMLLRFLQTSFKGASIADWKMDDAVLALQRLMGSQKGWEMSDALAARVKALEWWAFGGVTIETPEEHAAVNKIRAIQASTRALIKAEAAVAYANSYCKPKEGK